MSIIDLEQGIDPNLEAALARARKDHFLGEEEEQMLRERNLPPAREIAYRELIAALSQNIRPQTTVYA